ncbi:nitrite reductase small subunit NirD [Microbacterium foliorum]|uniref:Nitrite reductase small subunit NirD n=1 Tax=Microbacterium foliorum TaxID=104336 RepID=A0A4Y5YM24_9MICO|nr:nitrite reductase small subunit NirD [Microbacterium foliorum]QDE33871.1 nitrite reductase small subunit NirD [Microbacterium foliorum]
MTTTGSRVRVCAVSDLEIERGRAALFGTVQVALFLLADASVHAVSNLDPYSGAHVMSRGIVGSRGEAATLASPMHKQVFDLRTGECLETQGREPASLRVWSVTVVDGHVELDIEEMR